MLPSRVRALFDRDAVDCGAAAFGTGFGSLYRPLAADFAGAEQLPRVGPEAAFDSDDFFVTNVPDCLCTTRALRSFICRFGCDILARFDGSHGRIVARTAVNSHRIRSFLPFIDIDGARMQLHEFPFFWHAVHVEGLPSGVSAEDFEATFARFGPIESAAFSGRTGRVVYADEAAANCAVAAMDLSDGLRVSRFCDCQKLQSFAKFRLFVPDRSDVRALIREFSQFGPIFFAGIDVAVGVGRIDFYCRADALKAQSATAVIPSAAHTVVVRNCNPETRDGAILARASRFGRVIEMKSQVVTRVVPKKKLAEVTFAAKDVAAVARDELDEVVVDGFQWMAQLKETVDVVPEWKRELRNQWLKLRGGDAEVFGLCARFGEVLDVVVSKTDCYILFESAAAADDALDQLQVSHNASHLSITEFAQVMDLAVEVVGPEKERRVAIVVDPIPEMISEDEIRRLWGNRGALSFVGRKAVMRPSNQTEKRQLVAIFRQARIELQFMVVDDLPPPETEPRDGPCVVVDPLPDGFEKEPLRGALAAVARFDIEFGPSAVEAGKERAIIKSNHWKGIKHAVRLVRRYRSGELALRFEQCLLSEVPRPLGGEGG
jgi:RNA recognition motif-containing protein